MAYRAPLNFLPTPVDRDDPRTGPDADRLQALQAFNAKLVCMTVDESSYVEVVQGVWKVIGCDSCALYLHDRLTGDLVLKGACGYEGLSSGHRISLDNPASVHAQAFLEEYLVHLDDVKNAPDVTGISDDVGSVLVLPVISNKGPVGVFDFSTRPAEGFSPQDVGMCSMLVDQMAYSLENIRLVGELSNSRDAVIRGMAMLSEIRDPNIAGHLNRICAMSGYLARKLLDRPGHHEVTPSFVDTIQRAAALHDVGKVGIPDSILLKPGKLTPPEYEVMKSHTTIGAEMLAGLIRTFGKYAMIYMGAEVARSHHEWWNGEGYPDGRKGEAIPLSARIVALCDVYDALTSRRVYKDAWAQEEAIQSIRDQAGKQFDPELTEILLARPQDLQEIRTRYEDA